MTKMQKAIAASASALVVLLSAACSGQPADQTKPAAETSQAPAQQAAPEQAAQAPTEGGAPAAQQPAPAEGQQQQQAPQQ
jgi:hypothetical protein